MHGGLAFASFRNAQPGIALYEKGMSHWSLDQLAQDVKNGSLPQVSWILPSMLWSEHPVALEPTAGCRIHLTRARGADRQSRGLEPYGLVLELR